MVFFPFWLDGKIMTGLNKTIELLVIFSQPKHTYTYHFLENLIIETISQKPYKWISSINVNKMKQCFQSHGMHIDIEMPSERHSIPLGTGKCQSYLQHDTHTRRRSRAYSTIMSLKKPWKSNETNVTFSLICIDRWFCLEKKVRPNNHKPRNYVHFTQSFYFYFCRGNCWHLFIFAVWSNQRWEKFGNVLTTFSLWYEMC